MKVLIALWACYSSVALAQTAENVLLLLNQSDSISRRIGEYYLHKRAIPLQNVCTIAVAPEEKIPWDVYQNQIERPLATCLKKNRLEEKILYIVTTLGVPLKITGSGSGPATEVAAVDSELTLLYAKSKGTTFQRPGMVNNPFFRIRDEPFRHPRFPIYLVTRLAGYDFEDVKGIIDRSLEARNRGKFVIDLRSDKQEEGNNWLRTAATLLPADRIILDETAGVLYDQTDVIGYASWGSNDPNRKRRKLGFHWLPGAIVTEFVSTDGRTFQRPPDSWGPGALFAGTSQNLTADYIHEGATGCSGHVYEPYLVETPRPDFLFPAYYSGRNLAESYYLSIPSLSWQNIVIGDPLCKIGKPQSTSPKQHK